MYTSVYGQAKMYIILIYIWTTYRYIFLSKPNQKKTLQFVLVSYVCIMYMYLYSTQLNSIISQTSNLHSTR